MPLLLLPKKSLEYFPVHSFLLQQTFYGQMVLNSVNILWLPQLHYLFAYYIRYTSKVDNISSEIY